MCIRDSEHAERFGLSQLHQLRGRVGRGKASSTCLLLYQPPLSETARIRLQTIRDSDDGFMIAEQDLKLRGSGELLGTRQSGLPEMKIANLAVHFDLLELAKKDADYVLNSDPLLNSEILTYALEQVKNKELVISYFGNWLIPNFIFLIFCGLTSMMMNLKRLY